MSPPEEKFSTSIDDLPYFAEKYPGKICCLCNLGERSSLGQGDFLRIETSAKNIEKALQLKKNDNIASDDEPSTEELAQIICRRTKVNNKSRLLPSNECINELDKIGHPEHTTEIITLLDGIYMYVHRMCAMWSAGVVRSTTGSIENLEIITSRSLKRRCSFCGVFGASVSCKMSCKKIFHLPCAAASGALLITSKFAVFCVDHLSQAHLVCSESSIVCHQCSSYGDISKLVMCSTCGGHYHTTCVGLANQPDTKSGWNCSQCSKCQICRQQDSNEGRTVKCEQCQKVYHATCLRPVISSIPKYGWKCNRCRICTDCGSRTPGAGTSSRWHCHYTICDSCYQQRNKGFSCPICHRAYRAAAHKEMVKCSSCNRFVHGTCDSEADLSTYHKRKENNPDYDYVCPHCKKLPNNERELSYSNPLHTYSDFDMSSAVTQSTVDSYKSLEGEFLDRGFDDNFLDDCQKNYKKRIGFKDIPRRGGKTFYMKANPLSQLGRKRAKGKNRHMLIFNSPFISAGDRGLSRMSDDDFSVDKKVVLCSSTDKFILSQDLCVMCGAIGYDKEGCLIACAQCGQCYHPYCVNIKVSKVMLEKGWRCLDCTVCEGCGQKNDESRLLLCDDCDISYHIYCMTPPLDTVPHGNWKCKWCAICQKCGRNSPGKNSQWRSGFLECGPCASQNSCCICSQTYTENDLIIQCKNCERWLHCHCDSIKSEEEAQFCDSIEYHCKLCRPKDKSLSYIIASKALNKIDVSIKSNPHSITNNKPSIIVERLNSCGGTLESYDSSEPFHWVDGVCVSERGLNLIKSLTTEVKKKRKIRSANEILLQKDLGILATIESVVSGSLSTPTGENFESNSESAQKKDEYFKDGMVWHGQNTDPPLGFSLTTNEEGVNILRKKRQRNLQKLGIGGFNVRNRAPKKEIDDNIPHMSENTTTIEPDKKKKIIRKKVKSKLIETYPVYLQEAFFGKELLSTKEAEMVCLNESDSSEESCTTLLQFNKTNKDKSTQNQIVHFSNSGNITLHSNKSSDSIDKILFTPDLPKSAEHKRRNSKIADSVHKYVTSQTNFSFITENIIQNRENSRRNENESNLHGAIASVKSISSEEPIVAIESKSKEIPSSYGINPTPTKINKCNILSETPMKIKEIINNDSNQSDSKTEMHSRLQLQDILPEHFSQQSELQNPILMPLQSCDQKLPFMQASFSNTRTNNLIKNSVHLPHSQEEDDSFAKQDIMLSGANKTVSITSKVLEEPIEAIAAGTQKTAEKMRRDEELGAMATISAVLYSNTQHPELKQTYPNWNDRCKQILKRWRSLSTEKKAPFLQQAKDNRSALRMRRSQQEQERTTIQHKVLKEQEQERIWKLHQAKIKEIPTSGSKNESNKFDPKFKENDMQPTAMYTYNNLPNSITTQCVIKEGPKTNPKNFQITSLAENVMLQKQQNSSNVDNVKNTAEKSERTENLKTCHLPVSVDKDNKQLRTLLQKESTTSAFCTPRKNTDGNSICSTDGNEEFKYEPKENENSASENKNSSRSVHSKNVPALKNTALSNQEQQYVTGKPRPRNPTKFTDCSESTSVNELEKLDPDAENAGFSDILGGFGEGDDDDLLKSLTAEMGDDFNILEYADPELDALANNQTLLSKLDFDDGANNNKF